jgi:hypothetical protein
LSIRVARNSSKISNRSVGKTIRPRMDLSSIASVLLGGRVEEDLPYGSRVVVISPALWMCEFAGHGPGGERMEHYTTSSVERLAEAHIPRRRL